MDLLQFLVLCAWDGSLEQVLAMQRSEIEARMEDSYKRSEGIRRVALEEAVRSADRSNADLKAQVLQGLTDLPDLFDLPSHNRRRDGSQTDRAHLRKAQHRKEVKKNDSQADGSQTERTHRQARARAQRIKEGLNSGSGTGIEKGSTETGGAGQSKAYVPDGTLAQQVIRRHLNVSNCM